jgi:hypothetical protein
MCSNKKKECKSFKYIVNIRSISSYANLISSEYFHAFISNFKGHNGHFLLIQQKSSKFELSGMNEIYAFIPVLICCIKSAILKTLSS